MIENPSAQNRKQDQNPDQALHQKIRLTRQMKHSMPQYIEILGIFEDILRERKKYKSALDDFLKPVLTVDPALCESRLKMGIPLINRNTIDFNNQIMAKHLTQVARILKSGSRNNPDGASDAFPQDKDFQLDAFIGKSLADKIPLSGHLLDFLISETLNPVLAIYAEKIKGQIDLTNWNRGYCPVCGELPSMAALSEETGKRKLISLACGTEWEFSRVKCPCCENEDQRQLSYLYIENEPRYRIETCDRCRRYIKTIDLRHATLPVDYEIENIITVHLDLIARENGYGNQGSVAETQPEDAVYH